MMVIFVSQCEKKAHQRSRRILDAFANRIGDNTWQTVITEDGLHTVKQLLRQTATKNTAVSCHWIRSRSRSDLLWIVGNRRHFNLQGRVPVNYTKRNLLHREWESQWEHLANIQIIATLAALFHDLGKSTRGFQRKLRQPLGKGDPYRHEWISLKIFEWLLQDCDNDQSWLIRLTNIKDYLANPIIPLEQFIKNNREIVKMQHFPPLAQWIGWLIVTHHRTAPFGEVFCNSAQSKSYKQTQKYLKQPLSRFYQRISAVDFWVKNPKLVQELSSIEQENYWYFEHLVLDSPEWQRQLKRWCNKALQHQPLMQLSELAKQVGKPIEDPLLLDFSRLCLMMADYHYSSLPSDDRRRVSGDKNFTDLAANTDRNTQRVKQALDEHLLGVAKATAQFARVLPVIKKELPTLKQQDSLIKNTSIPRFAWQNKAFQLAKSVQTLSQQQGFFGVNMASTGGGKTISNARIMYALADKEQGARFTVALGLRVLTLQTGQSYRDNLGLTAEQLAILVGGSAQRKLYEILEGEGTTEIQGELAEEKLVHSVLGSESSDEIIEEFVDSEIDYGQYDVLNLAMLLDSPKAKQLLFSPISVCTVDHLIQATECKRGGRYLLPVLRLLSCDLILDEPDDFDQADLPALTRLVHLVGLLGGRVLLSSATLSPDLIQGLFNSYFAGRAAYHRHYNKLSPQVVCAWIDEQENAMKAVQCQSAVDFSKEHSAFIQKRVKFLQQQPIRRMADILPLKIIPSANEDELFSQLAQQLANAAVELHQHHHNTHSESTKNLSVGLIRIANTKNIIGLAKAFGHSLELPEDTHIHLCCYHAKQVMLLRNVLEHRLDNILKRDQKRPEAIFTHSDIVNAMTAYPAQKHIFIVLATPVAEVGRDHDYDWAIVEPSSMRSIVQLAGRIWRHRPNKVAETANIFILQKNIRALKNEELAFVKPGFESKEFSLATHDMFELMTEAQRKRIDSVVKIQKANELAAKHSLADLEHWVIHDLMNNDGLNFVNAYWDETATSNRATTHLQILSPFRAGRVEDEWLLIPENDALNVYATEQVQKQTLAQSVTHNSYIRYEPYNLQNPQVSSWLVQDFVSALNDLQQKQPDRSIKSLAVMYSRVGLEENTHGWGFNEWLGFWRNK